MAAASGVELLRKPWEIEDHWVLRRDFMITHRDKFPPERLLCMAQLFVNIETLGVQYEDSLMDEIRDLASQVPSLTQFRRKKEHHESEERFKPPPKTGSRRANEGVGSRTVTHERYQSTQQNYAYSRQQYSQYQQVHGYGKAQQQFYSGQTFGQGYNAQPQRQHQSALSYPSRQYQQSSYQQPSYSQPVYGRNAVQPSTSAYQQQQDAYSRPHAGAYGQRQDYGRQAHDSRGAGASGSSYHSLLTRGQRR